MTLSELTLDDVCREMAATINRELKVKIEVTARSTTRWTISGPHAHANRAACWLKDVAKLVEDDGEPQQDEDETFIYLKVRNK